MSENNRHKSDAAFTTLLWVVILIAVLGGVLSFLLFAGNLIHFSTGYDKVYSAMLQQLQSTPLPVSTPDPNATALPIAFAPDPNASKIIAELQELHTLQAQVNGKDLLVFLYQFISAILIGVGAKMVADTKKNQESVEKRCIEINSLANTTSSQIAWNDAKISLSTAYNMISNCLGLLTINCNDATTIQTVSAILTRFNETLLRTLERIKRMDVKIVSGAEIEYFVYIFEGIKFHIDGCNSQNDTVLPQDQVRFIVDKIDEVENMIDGTF